MESQVAIQRKNAYQMNPRHIIVDNSQNPRKDYGTEDYTALKESIRENGLQYPVSVHEVREGGVTTSVRLTHGFRRMRAVNELIAEEIEFPNSSTVPVMKSNGDRKTVLIEHMVLNGGKELTPLEKADAVIELRNLGLTYEEIAKRTGMRQQIAYNYGRFGVEASAKVRQAVEVGQLTITTASKLVSDSSSKAEQDEKLEAAVSTASSRGKTKVSNVDVPLNKRSFGKKAYMDFYAEYHDEFPEGSAEDFNEALCDKFGFR